MRAPSWSSKNIQTTCSFLHIIKPDVYTFFSFPHIFLAKSKLVIILTSFVSRNRFNLQKQQDFLIQWVILLQVYYCLLIIIFTAKIRQAAGSLNWIGSTSIYRNGLALVSWLWSSFIRLTLKREHHVPSGLMNEQSIKKNLSV